MSESGETLALAIARRLQDAGHIAYWAGGCVRDRLMARTPNDYDVATSARPDEVLRLFPRSQKVGVAFGVVLIRKNRLQVEVATFRTDSTYSDGRHPDSVTFTDAQNDARRRDFTCNGLFLDPISGQLHDFVGGRQDIQLRILRAIGDPQHRFAEDHLRLLRAVRFAAKLEFSIDDQTFAAMRGLAPHIRSISRERIHGELAMILAHHGRAAAADLLDRSGLLDYIWPAALLPQNPLPRTWSRLQRLPTTADFVVALAAMHQDLHAASGSPSASPAPASDLLRQALLLSNAETADLAWLLDQFPITVQWPTLSKARFKRLVADPRWPRLEILFRAAGHDTQHLLEFDHCLSALRAEGVAPPPYITGQVLLRLGASPGPAFKAWIDALYDRQLAGEFASLDQAIAAAQTLIRHAEA